jgi:hypothetical protein
MFSPQLRKMSDGGMMPVEPSTFVKEIPHGLVRVRRMMSAPQAYQQTRGYGGGYSRTGPAHPPPQGLRTTWRR